MAPSPRALAIAAAALALAVVPAVVWPALWPLVAVFWALFTPLLIADALLARRQAGLRWRLDSPGVLHVGVPATATLHVESPAAGRLRLSARLTTADPLAQPPTAHAEVAGGPLTHTWELFADRRGPARIDALWLRVESPLGLWRRTVRAPLERALPVLPDIPRVKAEALRFDADREFRLGLKTERYRGEGSEFESLREYVRGDDPRAIDWKSTARHRRLLTRQVRAERDHNVFLAVDTGRLMAEPLGRLTRLDHSLQAALSLAHVCLRTGDRVGLFTFAARPRLRHAPSGGVHTLQPLLAAVAATSASEEESNYTFALTQLGQSLTRRSLVVLLTEFADTVSAQLMLENVGRLVRRHELVFVTLRDPLLDRLGAQVPDSGEALGAALVAHRLRRDRERVHRELRRMGVHTLDAAPHEAAPGLIRRYLDLRRRERV